MKILVHYLVALTVTLQRRLLVKLQMIFTSYAYIPNRGGAVVWLTIFLECLSLLLLVSFNQYTTLNLFATFTCKLYLHTFLQLTGGGGVINFTQCK